MKPTLYEALGLSQTAAESEIKAALRRLVRRYYAKTRAGHTDVEEALRFLNHASHVLGNPQRRAEYDSELAKGVSTESALTTVGEMSSYEVERPRYSTAKPLAPSITGFVSGARERPPPEIEAIPEWSAQLADFRRTRAGELAGLLVALMLLYLVWKIALPSGNAWPIVRFAILGSAGTVILACGIIGIVHLMGRSLWKLPEVETAATIVEGMIPRWRRDRTVFMGTGGPVEDATWLFRLRMAELKRVSAERVSDPQPVMRFFARMFDYGAWGTLVLGLCGLIEQMGAVGAQLAWVLTHPLIAPVIVTASWMPVEALLLKQAQTTPGRWLLCVYLHYQVSNPYAPEEVRFTYDAALGRAFDVWWRGLCAAVPLLCMIGAARARERIERSGETGWDSERDCLVTHGPVGRLSLVSLAIGLAAAALAFAAWWVQPAEAFAASVQRAVTQLAQSAPRAPTATATAPIVVPGPRIARVDEEVTRPAASAAPATSAPASVSSAAPPASRASSPVPAPAAGERMAEARAPERADDSSRIAPRSPDKAPVSARAASTSVPVTVRGGTVADTASAAPAARDGPSPLELRERRVAGYMQQSKSQQARGDFQAMARTCQRWADEDWRNPRAFYCVGLALQAMGRHKEAIGMFNRAGALLDNDDPLKLTIGDAVVRSFRADAGGGG